MALAIFRTEEICPVEKDVQKHNIIIEKGSANSIQDGVYGSTLIPGFV